MIRQQEQENRSYDIRVRWSSLTEIDFSDRNKKQDLSSNLILFKSATVQTPFMAIVITMDQRFIHWVRTLPKDRLTTSLLDLVSRVAGRECHVGH